MTTRVDQGEEGGVRLDADRLLQRARRVHRHVRRLAGRRAVELYQRTSHVVRVVRGQGGTALDCVCGVEEGTAVRVASGEGGYTFGAASGADPAAAEEAMARSLAGAAIERGNPGLPWRADSPAPLLDRREGLLPSRDDLARWLRLAVAHVEGSASPVPIRVGPAWVEAGLTAENLVADQGLAASRTRTRCWTMARIIVGAEGRRRERVRAVAVPTPGQLPREGWPGPAEEPVAEPAGRVHLRGPLRIEHEAAAFLVEGLARTVHAPGVPLGGRVGPGWRLRDDPTYPEGLAGGAFDDAGFDTKPVVLADGERVRAATAGPGHLRRPSFRDPPRPRFSTLVVESEQVGPPDRGTVVRHLKIHPLGPDLWILELEGHVMEEGKPAGPLREWHVRTRPEELALGVIGRVGPACLHPNGVATPALILELTASR